MPARAALPSLPDLILGGRLDALVGRLHAGVDLQQASTASDGWRGHLPLHIACGADVPDLVATAMVTLLLTAGAVPDALSLDGETALQIAARSHRPGCVKALLNGGADPLYTGTKGLPAAHAAAGFARIDILDTLVQHGVPLDHSTASGQTLLLEVLRAMVSRTDRDRWLATLDWLIAQGANVNLDNPCRSHESPLTLAATEGMLVAVDRLLAAGADRDHAETFTFAPYRARRTARPGQAPAGRALISRGWTALHLAAIRDHASVVERLLLAGADPTVRCAVGLHGPNDTGQTPLDLARENNAPTVIALFERRTLRAFMKDGEPVPLPNRSRARL